MAAGKEKQDRGQPGDLFQFMAVLEALPQAVLLVRYDGPEGGPAIRLASSRLARLLGIDGRSLLGSEPARFWEQLTPRMLNPLAFRGDLQRIEENLQESRSDFLHLVRPEPLVVERSTEPVRDPYGTVIGRLWTFVDASRQFGVKSELAAQRKLAAGSRSLVALAASAPCDGEKLNEACQLMRGCLDVASVLLVAGPGEPPTVWQGSASRRHHLGDREKALALAVQAYLATEPKLDALAPVAVGELPEPLPPFFAERGIAGLLLVPVAAHGRPLDLLIAEETERTEWSREKLRSAAFMGEVLGLWRLLAKTGFLLAEARAETQAAGRVRSDFIALLSHELRTPLNPLIGFTQLLEEQREELPGDARDMVTRISEGATRLRELVEDLLTLTRLDSRLDGWRKYPCDPASLVTDGCHWARSLLAARSLSLEMVELPAPGAIVADGAALRRAFNALLTNAIRFSPEGGRIRVSLQSLGDRIRLAIQDEGPGVPDESKQRIFEPFVQGEPVLTRRHGGAGIGLTLVRKVAESHLGRTWVEDGPQGGSIFYLELPRKTP